MSATPTNCPNCPNCGAEQFSSIMFWCGTMIGSDPSKFRPSDFCHDRAARQKAEAELAKALRKVVEAAGLLSKLMPYLRHQHSRCVVKCECGLNEIIMEAGKAAGVVATKAKEGK